MASPSEMPPSNLLGGKIRLLQRIGRGGMGDVWIARNEATQAEVAVKTLQRSERTETHDERFRREARLAATLSHRNVVRIFDLVDDEDGTLGLVMELLRGGTLEACIRERAPLSSMHAVAVATPILSALHHVHQKGIVHRDVKPANVFFAVEPDGHVIPKILDFGIAKLPAAGSALTLDGSVLGTPHYMSPEQIRGQEDLDGRSDMFSLAVLLYEMLTGVRVFQRDSAAASLAAVLEHEVDPDPRIDPRVWVALSRALAKRPYERFASCGELADALRAALDATDEDLAASLQDLRPRSDAIPESGVIKMGGLSSSSTRGKKGKKSDGRSPLWTIAAIGIAAALGVSITLAVTQSRSTPARADDGRGVSSASGIPSSASATPRGSSAATTATSSGGTTAATIPLPADVELGDTPPPLVSGPKVVRPRPLATPGTGPAKPAASAKKPPGPVATSPGF